MSFISQSVDHIYREKKILVRSFLVDGNNKEMWF